MSFLFILKILNYLNQDAQDLGIYRVFYEYLSGDVSGFKDEFFLHPEHL
jgi:hypothetical protein